MADFNLAVAKILKDEGGYVNNPDDKGGETKYGISKRSYPNVDIKNLTQEQAADIYRKNYWRNYSGINSQEIADILFEVSVNCGTTASNRMAQKALVKCGANIVVDGLFGIQTLAAINSQPEQWLLAEIQLQQINYYVGIVSKNKSQSVFLLGWIKRALNT